MPQNNTGWPERSTPIQTGSPHPGRLHVSRRVSLARMAAITRAAHVLPQYGNGSDVLLLQKCRGLSQIGAAVSESAICNA